MKLLMCFQFMMEMIEPLFPLNMTSFENHQQFRGILLQVQTLKTMGIGKGSLNKIKLISLPQGNLCGQKT